MKIQLSTFMISANFEILQFLNKGVVWALKGTKFIILSALFGRIDTFCWRNLEEVSKLCIHNSNENGI